MLFAYLIISLKIYFNIVFIDNNFIITNNTLSKAVSFKIKLIIYIKKLF